MINLIFAPVFNRRLTRYLLGFLVVFLFFLFDFLGFFNLNFLELNANRIKAFNYRLLQRTLKPLDRLQRLWNLTARLEDLEYRYREAAVKLTALETLEAENQQLRRLLENSDRKLDRGLIAKPIVAFSKPVIAVGSQDGISDGSMVLGEGILLGVVTKLQAQQAEVLLLKEMLKTGILAETENGVKGIVKGNGREILLTQVDSDEPILPGERVITSGQEGIKSGVLIGQIVLLKETDPAAATQVAVLDQLVSFYELTLVEIQ